MDSPFTIDLESDDPQSEMVWCVAWDSGSPGAGGDVESIYKLDGSYYYRSSSGENFDPFNSLEKSILKNELMKVFSATVSVDCPELSAEEIAKMLVSDGLNYGHELSINDELWVFGEPGVFKIKQQASSNEV